MSFIEWWLFLDEKNNIIPFELTLTYYEITISIESKLPQKFSSKWQPPKGRAPQKGSNIAHTDQYSFALPINLIAIKATWDEWSFIVGSFIC